MSTVLVAGLGAVTVALLARAARRATVTTRYASLVGARAGTVPAHRAGRIPTARWGALHAVGSALASAGLDLRPVEALEVWGGLTLAAGVLGAAASPVVAVLASASVLIAAPVWLRARATRQARAVLWCLPELLERVAGELRSGGTVATALRALAGGSLPAAADVARICDRVALGADVADALARWPSERPADDVRATAGALVTAHLLGGAAAGALDGLAASLRDAHAARAEARAQTTQARLSAWVVGVGPLAYLAIAGVVAPGAVAPLVTDPLGRVCFAGGLALLGTAGLVFRRMLREPV